MLAHPLAGKLVAVGLPDPKAPVAARPVPNEPSRDSGTDRFRFAGARTRTRQGFGTPGATALSRCKSAACESLMAFRMARAMRARKSWEGVAGPFAALGSERRRRSIPPGHGDCFNRPLNDADEQASPLPTMVEILEIGDEA